MKSLSQTQLERCKNILRFWHKVEFFIPFDLNGQILEHKDKDWAVKEITSKNLNSLALDESGPCWQVSSVPSGKQITGFDLYIGVFDKSRSVDIVQDAVRRYLDDTDSENDCYEQSERADLEGYTCCAKIKLSEKGEPLLDEVSVSTLPWALGRVLSCGLESLDIEDFNASLLQLRSELQNFSANRRPACFDDLAGEEASLQRTKALPLTRRDLEALENVFTAWAGIDSTRNDAVRFVIHAKARKAEKQEQADKPVLRSVDTQLAERRGEPKSNQESESDDDGEESDTDSKIDILNSFYLTDIKRIIRSIDDGRVNPVLKDYLQGLHEDTRIDLYRENGPKVIWTASMPNLMPKGRWMSEPAQPMSLMQQFAINNAVQLVEKPGMYSVNGPPGTGKTTLLRDIFADIFVCRARALAKCGTAVDALCVDRKIKVEFEDGKSFEVAPLKESLTGFEMVVVSSNNAAVENISRDLPKTKSLGNVSIDSETKQAVDGCWRRANGAAIHTYLQPIAHRIAAENEKREYESLGPDNTPWGLFSAALGSRGNRSRFAWRFSPPRGPGTEKPPKGYDPKLHQSFWEWRQNWWANPNSLNFDDAKKAFQEADNAVEERLEEIQELAALFVDLKGKTETSYTESSVKVFEDAKAKKQLAEDEFVGIDRELLICVTQLEDLRQMERLLQDGCPVWWRRWLRLVDFKEYLIKLSENREAQKDALSNKIKLQESVEESRKRVELRKNEYSKACKELDEKIEQWKTKCERRGQLRLKFPDLSYPDSVADLNGEKWQCQGLWQDAELAKMRSTLFAAALKLQESWLAEAGQFAENIRAFCKMLTGRQLSNPTHAQLIWQSLFMVVPVVSSTFASVANQFRDLGSESLGWLFVDEAGQAVPQAAAGALWRSRRAVVVGDPLQIEPVFTVPIKLIEALARISDLPGDVQAMPHKHSVQNLADEANSLGARIKFDGMPSQWIGSPLRVHRRCANPMFDVANTIAYDGKMIYGLKSSAPPQDSLDLGQSAWVQIAGEAFPKQAVKAQVDTVIDALILLYLAFGDMPPLYIISPFKAIKKEIIARIVDRENWSTQNSTITPPSVSALRKWCRDHVGTVHTFQGKEKSIVWMVLGCDLDRAGGANWASSKPNLLNVALTRAQHRFFMIGDINLWGSKPHFLTAKERLPVIQAQEFRDRMVRAGKPDMRSTCH